MTQWFTPRAFAAQRVREMRVTEIIRRADGDVDISLATRHNLRWLLAKGIPNEVGGIITAQGIVIPYDNITKSDPRHVFEMSLDRNDAYAYWHSHPTGPDDLSEQDATCMSEMFDEGLKQPWVIVSPQTITAWRVHDATAA